MINITPKFPKKVQFLFEFSFPLIDILLPRKPFIGGRVGYDKQTLFIWLLMKKILGWDYRTVGDMAGMAHTTLIRTYEWLKPYQLIDLTIINLQQMLYINFHNSNS